MAFIRNKVVRGKRYNYLVETRRDGGKVRSKTIVCLGRSVSIAEEIKGLSERMTYFKKLIQKTKAEQQKFEGIVKKEHGWDKVPKRCRRAKRMNRCRTGFEGLDRPDPFASWLNAPGDSLRALKDEMAWYHERTKKLVSYRNAVGRLSAQIDGLRQIRAKYPTITVSAAIKKQHDDAARESAEALERLAGKIEGHLPPKSC